MRKAGVAQIAIDAYCDCVDGLINGSLKAAFPIDGRNLVDVQTPAHRALQIARATTKQGVSLPNRVIAVATNLYGEALKDRQPVIFSRIAQICVDYKIIEPKKAAIDLETVANAQPDTYPEAIRVALDHASMLYKRAGDQDGHQRCQLGAVRQIGTDCFNWKKLD